MYPDGRAGVALFTAERFGEGLAGLEDGFLRFLLRGDGDDDDVLGCDAGREDQPVVVGVRHDEGADQAGRDAPRGGVDVFLLPVPPGEGDVLGLREVLPEVVGGAGLDGLLVLHHRLHREGVDGAGEAFRLGFLPGDDRDGEMVAQEVLVEFVDEFRFLDGLLLRGVGGVALLPEELGGAQEEAGAHLPAHHVGPLVDEQRQVAVALDPAREGGADDGLGGRADDVGFGQFPGGDHAGLAGLGVLLGLEAVMGDDRALGGEALDVLGLLLEVGERDEEREVGVLVAGGLEASVELGLDVLPEGVAPGLDDHAAADRGVLRQVGGADDLLVPLRVVLGPGRGDGGFRLGHVAGRRTTNAGE